GCNGAHGRTGEQNVAVIVLPNRENALHAAISLTASSSVAATAGAAAISAGSVTGVGTSTLRTPALLAACTSLPMSPMTVHSCGATPNARIAWKMSPGLGLRHAQPSSAVCAQTNQESMCPRISW